LGAGQQEAWLYLTADTNAATWAGFIEVIGSAQRGEEALVRRAWAGTVVWDVGDYNNEAITSRLSPSLALAVTALESAPVAMVWTNQAPLQAAAEAAIEIPLAVRRMGEFKETFNLKPVGIPGLDKAGELEVKDNATGVAWKVNLKDHKLLPGRYQFALRGVTKGKYRNQPEAAEAAKQEAAAAEATLQAATDLAKTRAAQLEEASQKADAAAQQARQAAEAAAGAVVQAAQQTGDTAVEEAVRQADQASREAAREAKHAADLKADAERSKAEADAARQTAEEAKKHSEAAAKAAAERAKPRDAVITVYSQPITLLVTPSPAEDPPAQP
jgi:pyruvate/2-oxoglutarate dehydrogenase complex dihydrolipoamide acyltransferase (E2) component